MAIEVKEGIKNRGFGSMTAEKKREVASMGGRAAHQMGLAHRWTSEEAQEAGRKGGKIGRRGPAWLYEKKPVQQEERTPS